MGASLGASKDVWASSSRRGPASAGPPGGKLGGSSYCFDGGGGTKGDAADVPGVVAGVVDLSAVDIFFLLFFSSSEFLFKKKKIF